MSEAQPRKSDLGVRTLTAIAMIVVTGGALWLGGWWWLGFAILIGAGVLSEWQGLTRRFAKSWGSRLCWSIAGIVYIGTSAGFLAILRAGDLPDWDARLTMLLILVGAVIATDIGAYFAGRAIGGPKIAPKISPSKTWAGLAGGVIAASIVIGLLLVVSDVFFPTYICDVPPCDYPWRKQFENLHWAQFLTMAAIGGPAIAVMAQIGDFFESWMKRRAGVKDSGNLLPGHGGLFDRLDGLLAVAFIPGLLTLISYIR